MTRKALYLASVLGLWAPLASEAQAGETCKASKSVLTGDTQLQPGCVYQTAFRITRPLTLDCEGSTLDGGNTLKNGIVIDSLGEPLSQVTIKNCVIQHFTNTGISVGWSAWDDEKLQSPREEIYLKTPHQIRIENTTVDTVGTVGIYLDDYVSQVEIRNSRIANAYGVGIYLEHSSRENTIADSIIEGNGRKWGDTPWQPGISVDSSARNTIVNNTFSGNGKSGVSLYRNCQEQAKENPHSVVRWQGASENRIADNRFQDEVVGVWVGERMSRNLTPMKCGLTPYYVAGDAAYVRDDAKHNTIEHNAFARMKKAAVIVEDDFNTVLRNDIQQSAAGILVSAPIREQQQDPIRGTVLKDNVENKAPSDVKKPLSTKAEGLLRGCVRPRVPASLQAFSGRNQKCPDSD